MKYFNFFLLIYINLLVQILKAVPGVEEPVALVSDQCGEGVKKIADIFIQFKEDNKEIDGEGVTIEKPNEEYDFDVDLYLTEITDELEVQYGLNKYHNCKKMYVDPLTNKAVQCLECLYNNYKIMKDGVECRLWNTNFDSKYAEINCDLVRVYAECDKNCNQCQEIGNQLKCVYCQPYYFNFQQYCLSRHSQDFIDSNTNIGISLLDNLSLQICQDNCYKCQYSYTLDYNCLECSYQKKRFDAQTDPLFNPYLNSQISGYGCTDIRENNLELNYLIKPDDTNCSALSPGGSVTLKELFEDLTFQKLYDFLEVTINITLLNVDSSDQNCLNFFINSDIFNRFDETWQGRLFERVSATVNFQAATDLISPNDQYNFLDIQNIKPVIVWRNHNIFFHVTKEMNISNIVFKGGDLALNENLISTQETCIDLDDTSLDSKCFPTSDTLDLAGNIQDNNNLLWTLPEGIFKLEFLLDYQDATIPVLNINNCEFQNFIGHKYAKSLISFKLAGKININNSNFQKMFFKFGLISNSHSLTQGQDRLPQNQAYLNRDVNQGHIFDDQLKQKCQDFNSNISTESDCHLIKIQSSKFQKYNSFKQNTYKFNKPSQVIPEGMILAINNVDGQIILKNNIFEHLVTNVNYDDAQTYDCTRVEWVPDDFSNKDYQQREAQHDISATSSYKIYFDKHIRKLLSYKREIGTVLHIRNLQKGLFIYKNTFNENIGTSGTNLLIEGFENTFEYPIIIDENIFSNNFAYHFSPSFSIVKNGKDYITNDCKGIFINKNIIKGNMGCNHTFGNIIVSCESTLQQNTQPVIVEESTGQSNMGFEYHQRIITTFDQFYQKQDFVQEDNIDSVEIEVDDDEEIEEKDYTAGIVNLIKWYKENINEHNPQDNQIECPYQQESNIQCDSQGNFIYKNQLTFQNNECYDNYLILSNCFYGQGFPSNYITNNIIKDNSIPINEIIQDSNLVGLNAFYTILGFQPTSTETGFSQNTNYAKESSSVILRFINQAQIKGNQFRNNSAIFSGDYQIAQDITLDSIIGLQEILLDDNIFADHQGLPQSIKEKPGFQYSHFKCSQPLISYNFYQLEFSDEFKMTDLLKYVVHYYKDESYNQIETFSNITIKNTEFYDNTFFLNDKFSDGTALSDTYYLFLDNQFIQQGNLDTKYQQLQQIEGNKRFKDQLVYFYTTGFNSIVDSFQYDELIQVQNINSGFENNFCQNVLLNLDNINILRNINQIGTSFISHAFHSINAKNIIFTENIIVEDYQIFENEENTEYNSINSDTGGFLTLNNQDLIAPKSDLNIQIINYENIQFNKNTGLLFQSYEFLKPSANSNTNIDILNQNATFSDIQVVEHTSTKSYFINMYKSSNIIINNFKIHYSNAPSTTYLFDSQTINLTGLDFQYNVIGVLAINPIFTNLGFTAHKITTNVVFNDLTVENNIIKDADLTYLSDEQKDIESIAIVYTVPYVTITIDEISQLTINNLNLRNNTSVINVLVGSESVLTINNFNISETNLIDSIEFTQTIIVVQVATLNLNNGNIFNVECKTNGGAIRAIFGTVTSNSVTYSDIIAVEGGVIYSNSSLITMQGGLYQNIRVTGQGSILQAKLGSIYITKNSNDENAVFQNNEALENTISTSSSYVSIKYSEFKNNFAKMKSKNLYIKDATQLIIQDCIFSDYNDTQVNSEIAQISFLYNIDSQSSITNSQFLGAISQNGAIIVEAEDSVQNLNNNIFTDNISQSTSDYGGAIKGTAVFVIESTTFTKTKSMNTNTQQEGSSCLYIQNSQSVSIRNSNFYENSHYSIGLISIDNVTIENVIIDGKQFSDTNYGGFNGGLILNSCSYITANTINIQNTKNTEFGGGFLIKYESQYSFSITNAQIRMISLDLQNNVGQNGPGLCFYVEQDTLPLQIQLQSSQIINNQATQLGGGIYYDCQNTSCQLQITNSKINQNSAIYGAGGIFYLGQVPSVDDSLTQIQENNAPYGENIGAYPIRMQEKINPQLSDYNTYVQEVDSNNRRLQEKKTSNEIEISEFALKMQKRRQLYSIQNLLSQDQNKTQKINKIRRILNMPDQDIPATQMSQIKSNLISGQNAMPPPILMLIDEYGQHVSYLNDTVLSITTTDSTLSFNTDLDYSSINGTYIVYPFNVQKTPGSDTSLTFKSNAINVVSGRENLGGITINSQITVDTQVRECILNEKWTDTDECEVCSEEFMNIYPDQKGVSCEPCHEGSICNGLYNGPAVKYWRLHDVSRNFLLCDNEGACKGAENPNNEQDWFCAMPYQLDPTFCITGWCAPNYKGNMCSTCIDGYAKSNQIYCVSCSDNPWYYIILALIVVAAILVVVVTIRDTLKEKKYEPGEPQYNRGSVLMKIIMNYFQLIAIISTFDFSWPAEIQQSFQVQNVVAESTAEVFSFDCFLNSKTQSVQSDSGEESTGISNFFMKLLMISVSPFIFMSICIIVWGFYFIIKYRSRILQYTNTLKANTITSVIIILFMIHTTIVETTIRAFRCKNLGDTDNPETYMSEDYDMKCYEGTHLYWVLIGAIPSLGLWGFIAPGLAFCFLYKNRRKLSQKEFKRPYGFLYLGYNDEKFYWEFVILYRKIIMIFISVFMAQYNVQVQAICVLGVGFIAYLYHIKNQPFIENDLNELENKSLVCATITLYCALYYLSGEIQGFFQALLFIIISLTNVFFFTYWIKAYTRELINKIKKSKFALKYFKKLEDEDDQQNDLELVKLTKQSQQLDQIQDNLSEKQSKNPNYNKSEQNSPQDNQFQINNQPSINNININSNSNQNISFEKQIKNDYDENNQIIRNKNQENDDKNKLKIEVIQTKEVKPRSSLNFNNSQENKTNEQSPQIQNQMQFLQIQVPNDNLLNTPQSRRSYRSQKRKSKQKIMLDLNSNENTPVSQKVNNSDLDSPQENFNFSNQLKVDQPSQFQNKPRKKSQFKVE